MTINFPYDNLHNHTTVNNWKMVVKLENVCYQLNIDTFYVRNKLTFYGYFEKDEH
jgi:hypothetical protein